MALTDFEDKGKIFSYPVGYICECNKIFLPKDWKEHKETCTKYKIEIEQQKKRFKRGWKSRLRALRKKRRNQND